MSPLARPLLPDERVVCYPYLPTAAAWTYEVPKGRLIRVLNETVAVVRLDDGTIRETFVENVRRAAGWNPPKTSRRAARKPPPLEDGWEQPMLGDFL